MNKQPTSAPTSPAKLLALPVSATPAEYDERRDQESIQHGSSDNSPVNSGFADESSKLPRVDSPLNYKYVKSPILTPVLEQAEDELEAEERILAESNAKDDTSIDRIEPTPSPAPASSLSHLDESSISSFRASLLDDDDHFPHTSRQALIEPLELTPIKPKSADITADNSSDDEPSDFCAQDETTGGMSKAFGQVSSPLLKQQSEIAHALKLDTIIPQQEKDETPLTAIRVDEKLQSDAIAEHAPVPQRATKEPSNTSDTQDLDDVFSEASRPEPNTINERPELSLQVEDFPLVEELRFGAQPALTPTNESWYLTSPTSIETTEKRYLDSFASDETAKTNLVDLVEEPKTPVALYDMEPISLHGSGLASVFDPAEKEFLSPISSSGRSIHEVMDHYASIRATRSPALYFTPIFSPSALSQTGDESFAGAMQEDEDDPDRHIHGPSGLSQDHDESLAVGMQEVDDTEDHHVHDLPSPAGWWSHTLVPAWMPSTEILDNFKSTATPLATNGSNSTLPGPAGWWLRTLTRPWMPSTDVLTRKSKPWKNPRTNKHKERKPRYNPGSWNDRRPRIRPPPSSVLNSEQQAASSRWKAFSDNVDNHDSQLRQATQDQLEKKRATGELPEKDTPLTYHELFKKTVPGESLGQRHIVAISKTTHSADADKHAVPAPPRPTPVAGPLRYDPWPAGMEEAFLSRMASRGTSPNITDFTLDGPRFEDPSSSPFNAASSSSPITASNTTTATTPSPMTSKSFRGRRGAAPSALVVDRAAMHESESDGEDDDSGLWAEESSNDETTPLLGRTADSPTLMEAVWAFLTYPFVILLALWRAFVRKSAEGAQSRRKMAVLTELIHDNAAKQAKLSEWLDKALEPYKKERQSGGRVGGERAGDGAADANAIETIGAEQNEIDGSAKTGGRAKRMNNAAEQSQEVDEEPGEYWWI